MTGRKNRVLQLPLIVPCKALGNFPKALYGTTGGTCSAPFFPSCVILPWYNFTGQQKFVWIFCTVKTTPCHEGVPMQFFSGPYQTFSISFSTTFFYKFYTSDIGQNAWTSLIIHNHWSWEIWMWAPLISPEKEKKERKRKLVYSNKVRNKSSLRWTKQRE